MPHGSRDCVALGLLYFAVYYSGMKSTTTNSVQLTINQQSYALAANTFAHNETLLKTLHKLGLPGTKEGCGDGDCGACTVAWCAPNSTDSSQPARYKAINSCLVPTAQLAGGAILTVEGVAKLSGDAATLHPVQQSLIDCAGSQCGYCTPGFVMSLFCDYHADQLSDLSVEGNLCRCTGYTSIRLAIEALKVQRAASAIAALPAQFADVPAQIDSHSGTLFLPARLTDALALKQTHTDAVWLAGGTDLGLAFSQFGGAARHIALDHVAELRVLEHTDAQLIIGAMVRLDDVQQYLRTPPLVNQFPAVLSMLHWFAAQQVRGRATLGGNLGTASPIGDLLPVLLGLDAQIVLGSLSGERRVAAADYFLGYRITACQPHELVLRVELPMPKIGHISQSYKVGKRGSDDISIVSSCFQIGVNKTGHIDFARLAYGGVAAVPLRAIAAENLLIGLRADSDLLGAVKPVLQQTFTPLSDFRGSANYRQQLIVNLFDKFLREHRAAFLVSTENA